MGNRHLIGLGMPRTGHAAGLIRAEWVARPQVQGVNGSAPALSLLKGQKRGLKAPAEILKAGVDWMPGREESEHG